MSYCSKTNRKSEIVPLYSVGVNYNSLVRTSGAGFDYPTYKNAYGSLCDDECVTFALREEPCDPCGCEEPPVVLCVKEEPLITALPSCFDQDTLRSGGIKRYYTRNHY